MWIPWYTKFIFGITADSISIFGSRKKAWIILWGFIQTLLAIIAATVRIESIQLFVALLFLIQVAGCFMDIVVDSLMVI